MKVLEVNVDDRGFGGVYSLLLSVIRNKPQDLQLDIGALETFEDQSNIDYLESMGSHVYYLGYDGNKLKKQAKIYQNVKALLEKEKYDCVHIHSDVANKLLVSGLAAKAAGVPKIILHSHATGVDMANGKMRERVHMICRRLLPKIHGEYAACSKVAAKWMFPYAVEKGNVTYIHNGIETKRFCYDEKIRLEERSKLGLKPEDRLIGHTGRFMYVKNQLFLVKVFDKALTTWKNQGNHGELKLLLVGTGEMMEDVKHLAEHLGIINNIIFYGQCKKIECLYQAMDIFAMPSHFEGLGMAAVEAQSTGLPCIVSTGVPQDVDIYGSVKFLSIDEQSEVVWASSFCEDLPKRIDHTADICKAGYSIQDTVDQFVKLYQDK